ncbi:MAG: cellulase family glycosylhydrolase [Polyangiaceae bacterium]|nr:cellulase family glycosylhydrolase [Myxococcales bacterium]MCB9589271.1 cellulase family glycosylhydrolase [Polyangiaceae bacterium]
MAQRFRTLAVTALTLSLIACSSDSDPGGNTGGASGSGGVGGTAGNPSGGSAGSSASGGSSNGGTANGGNTNGGTANGGSGNAGNGGSSSGGTAGGAGTSAGGSAGSGPQQDTFYTSDGKIYDPCGEEFVMRGVNHPTMYVDRAGAALPEIAKTGANAVRLFWFGTHGVAINEAESAVQAAVDNQMVPILELHDSTCQWNLGDIQSYWTSSDAVSFIQKHQAHLIVNIANEASSPNDNAFASSYSSIVQAMRSAGIHVPLMIDAGRCGRDYQVLLDKGAELMNADPDHNLIFSAHLYDPLTRTQLAKLMDDFQAAKLPFIIGEFANREPPGCGATLDYGGLITEANTRGIGWLAWSWGDNDPNKRWNGDCAEFDMTETFAYDSLFGWGKEVAVSLPASIQNTSVRSSWVQSGTCN